LAVQETQLPDALQTMPLPQDAPALSGVPVSAQTGVPVVQEVKPTWQGLEGVQAAPELHETQLPLEQTMPEPQLVPSG
jgi:hypothetical protein